MTSHYALNGTDLDSVFAPWHSGWPQAAATNIKVAGADLNGRYAALASGSGASGTTFRVSSVDLNQIFAALGSTGVQVGTQPTGVSGSAAAGYPSGVVTSGATTCAGAKGGGSYAYTWFCSGCTANSPSSATTTFSATVNAGTVTNASAFCQISDGVTSVNTSTIPVSLQNTTPGNGNFSIKAGIRVVGSEGWIGYEASPTLGSGSNLTLPDGKQVLGLYDFTQTGTIQEAILLIGGFSSDPGIHYFTSIVANGKSHNTSEGTVHYTYSSGQAAWGWSTNDGTQLFGFSSGSTYPATLTY